MSRRCRAVCARLSAWGPRLVRRLPARSRGLRATSKNEVASEMHEGSLIAELGPQVGHEVKLEHASETHVGVLDEEHQKGTVLAMPAHVTEPSLAWSLRALARDLRRTGRSIGLLPFLVYAARRRSRLRVLLG